MPRRCCFTPENSGASPYSFSRTALNVPCFEGPSPTVGEKSTSPVIKSGVSNFPLSVNFPASRPTLPTRNSTGPENVTELPSPGAHFASEGVAPPQTLDCGSVTVRVPFPSPCASKRRKRCWSLAKVTSIFQLPVTVGESALAKTKANVFTAITRIIARAVFTVFSTSNLICAQIHWVRNSRDQQPELMRCLANSKFTGLLTLRPTGHPLATDHQSRFTIVAQALGELSALGDSSVLG
jgi:hypothetical protein